MCKHHHHHNHHKKNKDCAPRKNIERILSCEKRLEPVHEQSANFTTEEALWIANSLCIDLDRCGYDIEQFRIGLNVELEHGRINPHINITNNDPILTGKITLAHLKEFPDYYKRLVKMEEEAEHYWRKRR